MNCRGREEREARHVFLHHQQLDLRAPQDAGFRATRLAVELALADPAWRVSVQTHKILGID